jgi:hypothetical protein
VQGNGVLRIFALIVAEVCNSGPSRSRLSVSVDVHN